MNKLLTIQNFFLKLDIVVFFNLNSHSVVYMHNFADKFNIKWI
jgi:hypothetical protein